MKRLLLNRMLPPWTAWPFEPQTHSAIENKLAADFTAELVIGHIDQDGRVFGIFGPLPLVKNIGKDEFVRGRQFDSSIVLLDGYMLIRKHFRGNQAAFFREKENLLILGRSYEVNVPTLYKVDEEHYRLYKSMIMGRTLRDLMVNAGAMILTAQTQNDPELDKLPYAQYLERVWQRGQQVLSKVVPDTFLADLRHQIDGVHRVGVVNLSLTFGNVMVDQRGCLWLIDFEKSEHYRSWLDPRFWIRRRQDLLKFQRIYGSTTYDQSHE